MLAACAASPGPEAPILPAPPADFGRPVVVRPPKAGEDARVIAARALAGLSAANRSLANDAAFYADVERRFGAPAGP